MSSAAPIPTASELEALLARLTALESRAQARDERIELLEEENRWLKAQLFGRSSEKSTAEEINPEQAWLFNEAEALARAAESAPQSITIPGHERGKGGRKKLSSALPRVDVIHDLPQDQKICAADGTALERIGEEISEQLDFKPAQVRVIRNIRPKYACPCKSGVRIAPVPLQLLPKSLATPALLAHITTAKFVDGMPLYRQEGQLDRLGVRIPRATSAGWMILLGGTYVVPVVNLMREHLLEWPLIHCDETRLQVLKSDKAPTADHWMWVRAGGPPGRRIILFDYDPSRGGAVPLRLFEGYRGTLVTDGYEPYESVAKTLKLVHAGCRRTCELWPAPISIRSWKRRRPTASSRTHILRGCSRSCLWPRRSRTSRLYCLGTQRHHHPRARHHEKTANATPGGDIRGGGPRRRSELGARLSVLPKLSRCHIRSDDNDRRCLPADFWDHRFRPSLAPRTQTQERTSLTAYR